jgi:LmbE family N-acetylglucosaminyl deacetylase
MGNKLPTLLVTTALFFTACSQKPSTNELQQFAATETYPEDKYLDTVTNKKALVILAHDDDDCGMAGTISKLTAEGWTIKQLSLADHPDKKTGKTPAYIICGSNELILSDGLYRYGLDTMKNPYVPIPYEEIKKQFLTEKVSKVLVEKINAFNPSVIFTLDNEKGGYGHPEHIFISQLVKDLFQSNAIHAQRIYQSVYTDHMEKEIVDTWLKGKMEKWGYPHASTIANDLYHITGMPEPNVQITIQKYGETKMRYLREYSEDVKKNIRKFVPYYEDFDGATYFSVFNREFFRVIAK